MPRLIVLLATIALSLTAAAQDAATKKLRLRAVLHDPLHPQANLYVRGESGDLVPLYLALEGLTDAQNVILTEGALQLFSSDTIDPEDPLADLAATVKVPERVRRAIVFIFPAGAKNKPPYRMMVLNDDPGVFPKAETRVLNMTPLQMAMKAGEHSVKLPPAKLTAVPRVTKLNHMNQAPTAFYLKGEGANQWLLLAERPMKFTDSSRTIILLYQMPNAKEPRLRTLVDTELR